MMYYLYLFLLHLCSAFCEMWHVQIFLYSFVLPYNPIFWKHKVLFTFMFYLQWCNSLRLYLLIENWNFHTFTIVASLLLEEWLIFENSKCFWGAIMEFRIDSWMKIAVMLINDKRNLLRYAFTLCFCQSIMYYANLKSYTLNFAWLT